ncbi:hypothetical protein SALBM311S_02963 [Streptomyces alboniger]
MAQDEGDTPELQGLAQGYYAHAYRLADEAGDPELAATALAKLRRAVSRPGLPRRSSPSSVRSALPTAAGLDNPRAVAYYNATLANAAAQDDDRHLALRHLAVAETAIAMPPAGRSDSWAAHYSPGRWAHETGMIHNRLGDLTAAEEHLRLALVIHGLDRRRTRAIVTADLAGVLLRQGNADGALSTGPTSSTTPKASAPSRSAPPHKTCAYAYATSPAFPRPKNSGSEPQPLLEPASPLPGATLLLPKNSSVLVEAGVRVVCRARALGRVLWAPGECPGRMRGSSTWTDFLRSQADALPACDFFETVTLSGTRLYMFAVLGHSGQRIRVLGATAHPTASCAAQAARNLVMDLEDAGCRPGS